MRPMKNFVVAILALIIAGGGSTVWAEGTAGTNGSATPPPLETPHTAPEVGTVRKGGISVKRPHLNRDAMRRKARKKAAKKNASRHHRRKALKHKLANNPKSNRDVALPPTPTAAPVTPPVVSPAAGNP